MKKRQKSKNASCKLLDVPIDNMEAKRHPVVLQDAVHALAIWLRLCHCMGLVQTACWQIQHRTNQSLKGRFVHNLYQVLGLPAHATTDDIRAAIAAAQARGQVESMLLEKASVWLLDDTIRARYDAKLRETEPAFFSASTEAILPTVAPKQRPVNHKRTPAFISPSIQKQTVKVAHSPSAPASAPPRKRVKTATSKNDKGCLIAIAVLGVLVCLLLGILAWWGYSLFNQASEKLNDIQIEQVDTTPGWHLLPYGAYTVAQNNTEVVLMLIKTEDEVVPIVMDRQKNTHLSCHKTGYAICNVVVEFDQKPSKTFEAVQMDKQLLFGNDAQRRDWMLLLQDAQTMQLHFPDNPQQAALAFELGAFPSEALIESPIASDSAAQLDPEQQRIGELMRQAKAQPLPPSASASSPVAGS